jgi:hypothetical protein
MPATGINESESPTERMERELDSLSKWKKKTVGIFSYSWDGNVLTVVDSHGTQHFSRTTTEAVIFKNFK